mgnify:FL=1
MDTKQQKEFITMLESIKVPCDYDMDCSELRALFELYIMNKKNKNGLFDGVIYAFNLGFKRGLDCGKSGQA